MIDRNVRAGTASFDGLHPIVVDAGVRMDQLAKRSWREAEPGSSIYKDNELLADWDVSHLVTTAIFGAVEHLHALGCLIYKAHVAHSVVPMTLLRSSLEDGSRALWLLTGSTREERRDRALRVWYENFFDRIGYELRVPPTQGRTGAERQAQMEERARALGLPPLKKRKPSAREFIGAAGAVVGREADARRLYSLSSGMAHGRSWASMHLRPTAASPSVYDSDALSIRFEVDEEAVVELAGLCGTLIDRAWTTYDGRLRAP